MHELKGSSTELLLLSTRTIVGLEGVIVNEMASMSSRDLFLC